MTKTTNDLYSWGVESLLEIELAEPDDFLKIKETLTRIGVASTKDNILYQSCHILHKRGKYYCTHFKELFVLDGKLSDISPEDIARRNTIASMLEQWGLCLVVSSDEYVTLRAPVGSIKIISHRDKVLWQLQSKYSMRADRQKRIKVSE